MTTTTDQLLDQSDPNTAENRILQLEREVDYLKKKFVEMNQLDEAAGAGENELGYGDDLDIDENGIRTKASSIILKQWLALGLPSDEATNYVYAIADDSANNRVWVGGGFTRIGGTDATNIAYWDKATKKFYSIGGSLNGDVYAIAVYSDGTVIIGGAFTNANSIAAADYIAVYSSSTWAALGGGGGSLNGAVYAIKISGTDVYIGGAFTNAAGLATADYIVKYSLAGSSWSSIGGQLNNTVLAIEVYESVVYVGGNFTDADAITAADYIAKYNGSAWSKLGTSGGSISNAGANVQALLAYDNKLYIGGCFTNLDGDANSDYIGGFDIGTQTYFSIGGSITAGVGRGVAALAVSSDGYLHVGGNFDTVNGITNGYGIYNTVNGEWAEDMAILDTGADVLALMIDEDGNLFMGGTFDTINGVETLMIAMQPYSLDTLLEIFNVKIIEALNGRKEGNYTPTGTGMTNITGLTSFVCHYKRVDGYVIVNGSLNADPTAAGTTTFRLTLPIASDIIAGTDLIGVGSVSVGTAANFSVTIVGNTANNAAEFNYYAADANNRTITFTFMYKLQ